MKYSNGKLTVYISPALKEHDLPGERLIYHVLYTGMVERVRNVTWMSFLCVLLFFFAISLLHIVPFPFAA